MNQSEINDRVSIQDLYDRFYWAHNEGDIDTVRACFAPGAEIVRGGHGNDVITAEANIEVIKGYNSDPVGKTNQHHVTNLMVDPDPDGDPDRRHVRCYFLQTVVEEPPQIRILYSCRTDDIVQRINGNWVYAHRKISLNHPGTAPSNA